MLQGLRTVVYPVGDLHRAKEWYVSVLGFGPYFDEPFYVGFDVGGFELGLQPDNADAPRHSVRDSVRDGTGGVAYWGVADADNALGRLLELGATEHSGVQDVGEGIRLATVLDSEGNVFGIIENPRFSVANG